MENAPKQVQVYRQPPSNKTVPDNGFEYPSEEPRVSKPMSVKKYIKKKD
jgi:hypothetical protein